MPKPGISCLDLVQPEGPLLPAPMTLQTSPEVLRCSWGRVIPFPIPRKQPPRRRHQCDMFLDRVLGCGSCWVDVQNVMSNSASAERTTFAGQGEGARE